VQESRRLIESASLWFLRNLQSPVDCATTVGRFAPGIGELAANLDDAMTEAGVERRSARAEALREAGVPETLAVRVAGFDALASACDIVQIAANRDIPIVPAARTYFDLGARVRLDWLRAAAYRIPTETHWQRQAVRAIVDDLFAQQRALTTHVIAEANGKAGNGAVESWAEQSAEMLRRNEHVLADLDAAGTPDLAMLAVASRQLRGLVPD
jgi:glutamate dehydrogenase